LTNEEKTALGAFLLAAMAVAAAAVVAIKALAG